MCTALTFQTNCHYFGRNLDLEYSYQESVTITPRNYPFIFTNGTTLSSHHAIIGIATIRQNYPLYYDATNECGLSMAGLNFPGNAVYHHAVDGMQNISPYELLPWLLGQCKSVSEAIPTLSKLNLVSIPFSAELPLTPLHWILDDGTDCLTIEPSKDGLKIYENPIGILTNNPPFPYHMYHLQNYMSLTSQEPVNRFAQTLKLAPYSRGMGAYGLPGDLSSSSRFVRAAFEKFNSRCENNELSSVSQFFHILDSVGQTKGCTQVGNQYEYTLYSSCCNTTSGILYYKTYDNNQFTAISLYNEDLEKNELVNYPLRHSQQMCFEN